MNATSEKSLIQSDSGNTNSLFKTCLGIFLIPINLILCFSIYFAVTKYLPLPFLEHNGKYVVANLVSMSIILGIYCLLLKNNIHRILVALPYSIPIFLIPFEPLSTNIYIGSLISITVLHLSIMSYVGFKTTNVPIIKQFFSYIGSLLLGLCVLLVVILLINPIH